MGASITGSSVVLGYTAIHIISLALTLSVAVYTARNYWIKQLGRVFTALLSAATIWVAGSLIRLFVSNVDIFVAVTAFKYIGIAATPVLFVLFALLYDGKLKWVTRPVIVALSILPVLTIPVVATTQLHGLFYSSYTTATVDTVAVLTIEAVGPWYWLFAIFSWTLMAIGSGLLVHAGIKRSKHYQIQLLVLLTAVGISWAANILYVVWSWPHPALDPTPIGFAATSLLLGYGLFSTQLVDISPAARSLVFEVTDDPVLVVNPTDRVVDANDAAKPLLSVDDPVGVELTQALHGNLAGQLTTDSDTVEIDTGQRERHYQYRECSDPDKLDGRVFIFTEITELQNTQEATEQAHEQLRQIIDLVPDPLYVKTLDDRVLLSNTANAELHGLTPDEMEGKREEALEEDVDNIENFDNYRQREIEVIETGESLTNEETIVTPSGDKHTFRTTRIPFKTAGKSEDAVLWYARDVTEIKEYEQEIEDHRDKLEILNHVLRHDVRNDLQLIGGYVDTLASQQDHQNKQEFIETIKKSVSHAVETTETARELADVMLSNQTGTEYVDLKAVLTTESSKINSSYPEVSINHETPIPSIQIAASEMISSVFFNILKNAVRHNDKEDIEIDIAVTENKETVTVHIADNGPGIPDSQKEAVFGKGEHGLKSPGTGMGLYLVDTLVTSYGGEVWIEDNDPEGAVFLVELPKSN